MSFKVEISNYINSINKSDFVADSELDKFAELVNVIYADELKDKKRILKKVKNISSKQTLSYMLGISTIAPEKMSNKLKIKYFIAKVTNDSPVEEVAKLLVSLDKIPVKYSMEILKILEKNKHLLSSRTEIIAFFSDFSQLMAHESFKHDIDEGKDFRLFLEMFLELDKKKRSPFLNWINVLVKKVDQFTFFELNLIFQDALKLHGMKSEQLIEESSHLVEIMDQEKNIVTIVQAMGTLVDVDTPDRKFLIEALSHLKKGMGKYVSGLVPLFMSLKKKEKWLELTAASLTLTADTPTEHFLFVQALSKVRYGEKMEVAKFMNALMEQLNKKDLLGSEKALILKEIGQVRQKNRAEILKHAVEMDQLFKSMGKEWDGSDLTSFICALGYAPPGEEGEVIELAKNYLNPSVTVSEFFELIEALSQEPKEERDDPLILLMLEEKWNLIKDAEQMR